MGGAEQRAAPEDIRPVLATELVEIVRLLGGG